MNNLDEMIQELDHQAKQIERKRKAIEEIRPRVAGFKHDLRLSFGGYGDSSSIDIDYLGRAVTTDLITHFHAGKWDKELSGYEGKINYINKTLLTTMQIRIYGAEPPPSCKIVEVPEEIPAQPARTIIRKKVVCDERGLPAI